MSGSLFRVSVEGDRVVSRGAGAPEGRQMELPLSQLEGFCLDPEDRRATVQLPWDAHLVLAWREGPKRRHVKLPVLKDDPDVRQALSELERLRPEASLMGLPPAEAMKKLGLMDARTMGRWMKVAAVVTIAGISAGVFYARRKPPPGDHCGNLPVSCLRAVDLYLSDPEKAPMAAQELDEACSGDQLDACAALAPFLVAGEGVPRNPKRAMEAAQRACSAKIASGCCNLGVMYASGDAVERNDARAAELYKRACDLGDVKRGCYNYGMALSHGLGVAEDSAAAADLLRRACEDGEPNGCLSLGALYWRGQGVQKDPERARALWERACKAGLEDACTNLQLK